MVSRHTGQDVPVWTGGRDRCLHFVVECKPALMPLGKQLWHRRGKMLGGQDEFSFPDEASLSNIADRRHGAFDFYRRWYSAVHC